MALIERICPRHEFLIPSVIPGFVAAEEQQGNAAGIESIQQAYGFATVLHPQFPHVRELRSDNRLAVPIWKCRTELLQQMNIPVDAVLLGFIETFKPSPNSSVYSTSHIWSSERNKSLDTDYSPKGIFNQGNTCGQARKRRSATLLGAGLLTASKCAGPNSLNQRAYVFLFFCPSQFPFPLNDTLAGKDLVCHASAETWLTWVRFAPILREDSHG